MERKSWLGRAEYVVVNVALVGGVLFAAVLLAPVRSAFQSEVAAAWVQAVGAILAIVYAGKFARDDRQHALAEAAAEKVARLRATRDLVEFLFNSFDQTAGRLGKTGFPWDPPLYARQRQAPLRLAIETLEALPVTEIPALYIAAKLLNLRNMLQHALDHLDLIVELGFDGKTWEQTKVHINKFVQHVNRGRQDLIAIQMAADRYNGRSDPVVRERDLI